MVGGMRVVDLAGTVPFHKSSQVYFFNEYLIVPIPASPRHAAK